MKHVEKIADIKKNMSTLDKYLKDKESGEYDYAVDRIRDGICFIVARDGSNNYTFYPSRFIGYKDNNMYSHENNYERDGRDTNVVISEILEIELMDMKNHNSEWINYENLYKSYCKKLGFDARDKVPFRSKQKEGSGRKYWVAYNIF